MKKKNETFSMMVILLIPVAIAINIVGGQMTSILKIPVDLDMIGVILVGALAGPLPVWKLVISGIIIALVGTITATPITVFFFGGATGGGASMLAAGLMATGKQILESVLSVYIVTESVGKLISVFIAYFIIKAIPERSLVKYKYGEKFIKTKSN